jgi:hypothetical protein
VIESVPKRTGTPTGAATSMARPVVLLSPRKMAMRRTPLASGTASESSGVRGAIGTVTPL